MNAERLSDILTVPDEWHVVSFMQNKIWHLKWNEGVLFSPQWELNSDFDF